MGFLDKFINNQYDKVQEKKLQGGLFTAAERPKRDWLSNTLNKFQEAGREAVRVGEENRKLSFERANAYQKFRDQESEYDAKAGPKYTDEDINKLANDDSVSFLPSWHRELDGKKGGDLPLDVRKRIAEKRGVPADVFDNYISKLESGRPDWWMNSAIPDAFKFSSDIINADVAPKKTEGQFTKGTKGFLKKVVPDIPVVKPVAEAIGGGLARTVEVGASALDQAAFTGAAKVADMTGHEGAAKGFRQDAKAIDRDIAKTHFQTNDWKTNAAMGVDFAATVASLAMPGVGGTLGKTLALVGANFGIDMTSAYVSTSLMKGYEFGDIIAGKPLEDDDVKSALAMTAGADAVGTLIGTPGITSKVSKVPGSQHLAEAAGAVATTEVAGNLTGHDPSWKEDLAAAAVPGAARVGAKLMGKTGPVKAVTAEGLPRVRELGEMARRGELPHISEVAGHKSDIFEELAKKHGMNPYDVERVVEEWPPSNPALSKEFQQRMADFREVQAKYQNDVQSLLSEGIIDADTAKRAIGETWGYNAGRIDKMELLPSEVFHTTTAKDAVLEGGLKSREELGQVKGNGLGGGPRDTISVTPSKEAAANVRRGLLELRSMAVGDLGPQDIVEAAAAGRGAPAPYLADALRYGSWMESPDDAAKATLNHMLRTVQAGGEIDLKEAGDALAKAFNARLEETGVDAYHDLYQVLAKSRQNAGGFTDPFLMGDVGALMRTPEDQIATVSAKPVPGGRGFEEGDGWNGEWRVPNSRTLDVQGVVDTPVELFSGRMALIEDMVASAPKAKQAELRQLLMGAVGGAAAGAGSGIIQGEDQDEIARRAAGGAIAGVMSRGGSRILSAAQQTPNVGPKVATGATPPQQPPTQQQNFSAAARAARAQAAARQKYLSNAANAKATATAVTGFRDVAKDYIALADRSIAQPGAVQRALNSMGVTREAVSKFNKALDPAQVFNETKLGRQVLTSAVAARNYLRTGAGTQSVRAYKLWDILAPLTQEDAAFRVKKGFVDFSSKDAKRAAQQIGAGAGTAAAGYAAGEATGIDEFKELGVVAGAAALGGVSARQSKTRYNNRAWESVKRKTTLLIGKNGQPLNTSGSKANPGSYNLPEQLKSGPGKLYDILQRPWEYDLSTEQWGAVQKYQATKDAMTVETNAALEAAGMDLIPLLESHGILQWFTPESVSKFLGEEKGNLFRMDTPGFDRKRAPQLLRDIGHNYFEALSNNPNLQLIEDPIQLMKLEMKFHDQIRSSAMMVNALKDSSGAFKVMAPADIAKLPTPADKMQAKAEIAAHKAAGWKEMPGIGDHLFHPDILNAVEQLLMPKRGTDTGPLMWLDVGSNILRSTMFTGDLSAWTMQGLMAAINDPVGTVINSPHLIGASVFGDRYFRWWQERNTGLWEDFTKSGGVPGREHEGLEIEKLSPARLPGLKHLESHGFESFLPIHRALLYRHTTQMENFIKKAGLDNPLGRTASRAIAEAVSSGAPVVGAAAASEAIPGNVTGDDNMDLAMALALGFAGTATGRMAVKKLGNDGITGAEKVLAAKQVNRTSGAFNKQQYGITNDRAQWERALGFRSPALARNTIILMKKAGTDFGPEGAMARYYLGKTALLMGTALAAVQYAQTGEMPSFDPTDETSIFSPLNRNFLRAQNGAAGTLSTSNPIISLVRAMMNTDSPSGERKWRFEDWEPVVGLRNWYTARMPDIAGPIATPFIENVVNDKIISNPVDKNPGLQTEGNGNSFTGNASRFMPVALQQAFQSGAVEQTATGKDIAPLLDKVGLGADPNVNHESERWQSILGGFAGLNANPETLSRERTRLKTEAAIAQNPGLTDRNNDGTVDYHDLNERQSSALSASLKDDKNFQSVAEKANAQYGDEKKSPIDEYLAARASVNEKYTLLKQQLSDDYEAKKISAFKARERYRKLEDDRRLELDRVKSDLGDRTAGVRGKDMSVDEYLKRDMKPEDLAVENWYNLFDKATKPDGSLDFDRLEKLRENYLTSLSPNDRAYLDSRLKDFEKPAGTKFEADYETAKGLTSEYFSVGDTLFKDAAADDEFLSQFESYGELKAFIEQTANEYGVDTSDVEDALEKKSGGYRRLRARITREQERMARRNPDLDSALVTFYNRAPKSSVNKFQQRAAERAAGRSLTLQY